MYGLRPAESYESLAATYDPQFQSPPALSWHDKRFSALLDYDNFIGASGDDAAYYQIGCPNASNELDAPEIAKAANAYNELVARLKRLDELSSGRLIADLLAVGSPTSARRILIEYIEGDAKLRDIYRAPAKRLGKGLLAFFADRLKVYLRDKGARHDLIDAVFALPGQDDLLMIVRRVEALGKLLDSDDGKNLFAGYRRAANILRAEEKKDGEGAFAQAHDAGALALPEEKALAAALAGARAEAAERVASEDFEGAMRALARLRAPVDDFFLKVTVNADDPDLRLNRLRLLGELRDAVHTGADFSKIAG